MRCRQYRAGWLIALSLAQSGPAAQAPERPPRFTAEASAVVLDVVVRDGRGRPVTGLTRDDFEIFEDLSRQTVTVFEAPAALSTVPGAPSAPVAPASPGSVASPSPPRVVALVFEQLGPGARIIAAKAAHRLVASLGRGDFAGVFLVDRAVQTMAGYTPATGGVGPAIDRAVNRPGLPLRRAGIVPGAEFVGAERGAPTQETRRRGQADARHGDLRRVVADRAGAGAAPRPQDDCLVSEGFALMRRRDDRSSTWTTG